MKTRQSRRVAANPRSKDPMKYILMMSGTKAHCEGFTRWPKETLQQHIAFMQTLGQQLREEGVLVSAEGLAFPDQAKMVRLDEGGTPVTDGVFPESKEFLMGYWIVDVESAEEACKIALRASAAPAAPGMKGGIPIEVRQVMSGPPEEFL